MDMEWVRSSIAALVFLTLVVLAAASSGGGDDAAAAAAAAAVGQQWHPPGDEPYTLLTFHNKYGEEIRVAEAEQRSHYGFANRSGHWFYAIRDREEAGKDGGGKRRRPPLPLPESNDDDDRSRADDLWTTLSALLNTTAASSDNEDDDEQGYMLIGMETSGGDKIRLAVVAGQCYFFVTGFARGWFRQPRWRFREGERHRLLAKFGGDGSHAEFVASNVLASMMNVAKAYDC